MGLDPDERLLVEAAQRDPTCFADLYERNFYRVYAFIVSRVRDRHHAEDLTSEVFSEALAGIRRFEWRGVPFAAWLLRIAARAVADHWTRAGREAGDPSPDADAKAADEIERDAILFELVGRLSEAQFRVIHTRFVQQKSIREIALELNRSEGAIKQLQLRAIENLRALMEGGHA
jgi:RNA polymerase sigma-70 factor (ECF subfamily)